MPSLVVTAFIPLSDQGKTSTLVPPEVGDMSQAIFRLLPCQASFELPWLINVDDWLIVHSSQVQTFKFLLTPAHTFLGDIYLILARSDEIRRMLPDCAHQTSLNQLLAIISHRLIDGAQIRKLIESIQENTSFHGKLSFTYQNKYSWCKGSFKVHLEIHQINAIRSDFID